MKLDVLAIAAHPDDAELCCGGLLALSKKQGLKTGILDLTEGEMGSRGTVDTRRAEAAAASSILGLDYRHNLGLPDNAIANTREHQDAVIRVLRATKPDLVLISGTEDRHPDHYHAHMLVKESVFYSGLVRRETTLHGASQAPFRPHHVLFYHHDWPFEPDVILDVSDVWDIKRAAMLAYSTQFMAGNPSEAGPVTYISTPAFMEAKEARMRADGHRIGVRFGEAFQYWGGPVPMLSVKQLLDHKPMR